jgi:hypothetical protein
MTKSRPHPAQRRPAKTSAAVALWRPDIVLATSIMAPTVRAPVVLAEPAVRPEALRNQLGTAQSLLSSLADARQLLDAVGAEVRSSAGTTGSIRDRVSATIAAYRAEAKLDEVLTGTWRQVSALMQERGLR